MPGKADFVSSILPREHILTTYDDANERFLLICLFIDHCLGNHGKVVIVSDDAVSLGKRLYSRREFRSNLSQKTIEIFTWRQVTKTGSFSSFYRQLLHGNKAMNERLCFIGDPSKGSLVRFEVQEEIERVLDERRNELQPTILCLYLRNRLGSLEARNLLTLYKVHDAIHLSESTLRREPSGSCR